jgi:hypothetical protein
MIFVFVIVLVCASIFVHGVLTYDFFLIFSLLSLVFSLFLFSVMDMHADVGICYQEKKAMRTYLYFGDTQT